MAALALLWLRLKAQTRYVNRPGCGEKIKGFIRQVFFSPQVALPACEIKKIFGGTLMRSNLLRIAILLALALSIIPAATTFASDDDELKFTGTVESMPSSGRVGDYRIGGRTVHVTNSTWIEEDDGRLVVGAIVKVEGRPRSDGSVDAKEIEVKTGSGSGGSGGDSGSGSGDGAGEIKFKGTIQSFPNAGGFVGDWVIGGRTIHASTRTQIKTEDGPVAIGAFAEVEGAQLADGSINAREIDIKSNVGGDDGRHELKGVIESVPAGLIGDWRVSGRTVRVSASTFVDQEHGRAAVGAFVEVKGAMQADGSINATKIEVKTSNNLNGENGGFKGVIESLPNSANLRGDWTVSGRIVHVISSTRLKSEHGPLVVGARVKVKGIRMIDGSVVATKIQVRD